MAEHLSDEDVGLSSAPPAGHLSDADVGLLSDKDVGIEAPGPSYADRVNQIAQATQIVGAITNPAKGMGMAMHAATQAIGGAIESEFPALKEAQQQGQILPLENMGSVIENALSLFGGGPAKMPGAEPAISPQVMKAVAPAVEDFITNVMQPAAEKFVETAATEAEKAAAVAPAAQEERLRVAAKSETGKVYIGEPGEIHADLFNKNRLGSGVRLGFVDPEGNYLTRQQALKWVEERQPDLEVKHDVGQEGFLHGINYNEAIARAAPAEEPQAAHPLFQLVQQAKDLGVVGPEKPPPPPDMPPAKVAQQAIPAARTPDDKLTMTPNGEPMTAWETRFKDWVTRVKEPEDVKPFIEKAAQENNNFPEARAGEVPPDHVRLVAEAAGVKPGTIDGPELSAKFNTPDKIRMVKQALDTTLQDFKSAAAAAADDPSIENVGKMLEAEIRRDYTVEYVVGLRSEWARTGHALRDLLEAGKGPSTGLAEELKAQAPKEVTDVVHEAREFSRKAAGAKEKDQPLELDKLVKAAESLVKASTPKEPGAAKPAMSPEVNELVKHANAVVNLLKSPKAGEAGVPTSRPLRQIIGHGEERQPPNVLSKFNALISEAEKNVTAGVKAGKEPKEAMPPELKAMVESAEGLTKFLDRQRLISDLLASKGRTPTDMANIARSMRNLSDEDMARTLTNMRGKGPHWLHWAVSQALISGLITHTFYTGTNLMFMELERVVAPGIAAMLDKIRGNPDPILFGEVGAAQRAIVTSIPQAFQAAKQAFQTGLRVPLPRELELLAKEAKGPKAVERAMAPYTTGQPPNWGIMRRIASDETLAKVEKYGGLPGRSANFQHTFFKNLSFHASMDAQSYHMAAKEGLSPRSQEFADRQAFWKANPTDAMIEKGVHDGYSGTFMQELGENMAAFSRVVRNTPLKWVFFFTHIPMNIARASVEYTMPALGAAFNGKMRADMSGANGMSAQNVAYAKWTLGSSLASYFVYKGMMDEATGSYPTDPDEQRRWRLEGRQQNSVKAFGQWWSLERLGPPGIAAKIGADIGYIARNWDHEEKGLSENITNAMAHLALAFGNAYGTEAGMQGLTNIMDLVQGKRTPSEWAAYQAASFVQPISFLSQAASFADPNMRQAKTLIDGIKMRLPGLRQTLEVKRDPLFGDPLPNPGHLAIERHVPVTDPIKLEMEKVGYIPTAPSNAIGGVRLTPEQYDKYQATAGPLVHEALSEIVNSEGWKDFSAGDRRRDLEDAVKSMRAMAAQTIQLEYPGLIEAGIDRQDKFLETGSRKRATQKQ